MYLAKTIQFDKRGYNRQSMSFPYFDFKNICEEEWEDQSGTPSAELNMMLSESTMIFCVFQYDSNGNNFFKGFKFYNIPQTDIDGPIFDCWRNTVKVLKEGVKLRYIETQNSHQVKNNLPKQSESPVIHVRPHAGKAAYKYSKNSNELPISAQWTNKPEGYSNNYMTKQCFFLNNTYVKSKVTDLLD